MDFDHKVYQLGHALTEWFSNVICGLQAETTLESFQAHSFVGREEPPWARSCALPKQDKALEGFSILMGWMTTTALFGSTWGTQRPYFLIA